MISFPPPTEMFHFGGYRLLWVLPRGYRGFPLGGFPHSGIPGSQAACVSPGLIAACHALHRLRPPRHPPRALSYHKNLSHLFKFQIKFFQPEGKWRRRDLNPCPPGCKPGALPLSYVPSLWAHPDSNRRPYPYQGYALATELWALFERVKRALQKRKERR